MIPLDEPYRTAEAEGCKNVILLEESYRTAEAEGCKNVILLDESYRTAEAEGCKNVIQLDKSPTSSCPRSSTSLTHTPIKHTSWEDLLNSGTKTEWNPEKN